MTVKNHLKNILANINEYFLIFCSLFIIFGAAIYYFYALNWLGLIISLGLTLGAFVGYYFIRAKEIPPSALKTGSSSARDYFWLGLYLVILALSVYYLYQARTSRALISPWQVVSPIFFWLYAFLSADLIYVLSRKTLSAGLKILFLSLHYFLNLAVALTVYKIGYGFDPFVHQATMELIAKKALVDPKTPYYIGQYALIVAGYKFLGLSIAGLNKILVPLAAALFLPLAAYRFLKRTDKDETNHGSESEFLTVLFILGLTFAPFIATTPQNLAYLFLILTIFSGLSRTSPLTVLILALATTAIHPICGLPALAWSAWLFLHRYRHHFTAIWRKIFSALIFAANALLLPLALWLSGGAQLKEIAPGITNLITPWQNIFSSLSLAGREDWLSNLVYFLADNYSLLLIIAIGASLIYFYFARPKIARRAWRENGLLLIISSLLVAYVLSAQIHFNNLISYEQNDYANRILIIITLFALPYLIEMINRLIKKIGRLAWTGKIIWLIIGLTLLSVSLYISYPRYDKYFNSRGYSTGQSDVTAVNLIAAQARAPYIVLANQQVSAAALKELGFDHYYQSAQGEIYFYPIPTGGPLYQYYLAMVYGGPSRETMDQAMSLVNVKEAYLVVNKYWFQSDRVIGLAKLTADRWQNVDDQDYIFKYTK